MRTSSILLLLVAFVSCCKRDDYSVPKPEYLKGYASGTKNGVPWKGYCQAVDLGADNPGHIRLNISGYYDTLNWFLIETLYMGGLSPCVCRTDNFGPYVDQTVIQPTPWLEFGILEIDIIKAIFNPDTLANNYLEFTSIDTVAGVCAGKFSCTVVKYPNLIYPDSLIRFENCTFSTGIK